MIAGLDAPMTGDGCRAERLTEQHRDQFREAASEDPALWEIYYVSYAPEQFDASFDTLLKRPWIPFALYDGDAFVGISCFLNIEEDRQSLRARSSTSNTSRLSPALMSLVLEGIIRKGLNARLTREDVIVSKTTISSLRRFKDDVAEVRAGLECGVLLADTNDIKAGDSLEVFEVEERARTL